MSEQARPREALERVNTTDFLEESSMSTTENNRRRIARMDTWISHAEAASTRNELCMLAAHVVLLVNQDTILFT